MAIDYEKYKNKLEEEQAQIEKELAQVGRQDPDNPSNWQAIPREKDSSSADENTVADSVEDYSENNAIVNTLETRLKDVRSGLDKIKHNVYGTCQVCNKEIEEDRLEANPAARTCKEHMDIK
ncbi:MAG: TraR/DksA C4-type zinc finger protein [Parcubacteria group bacterium]